MSIRPPFKASDSELISKFHKLEDFFTLADLVELNRYSLERMFYEIKRQGKHYHEFLIEKKSNNSKRKILAPDKKLKILQRRLSYILSLIYIDKVSVHGFLRGKSIITNAERHIHRRLLLNIDLENFFPTIHFGRIRGRLQTRPFNLSRSGATIVAGFCSYMGKLPQGAPTSPIISNIICSKLDYELQKLAYSEHCTYSRYADDITFSTTKGSFPEKIAEMVGKKEAGAELNTIINRNGFFINKIKTRIRFSTERQEVTGLVVNKFPNVKRKLIKEVRMMLHIWKKFDVDKVNKKFSDKFYEILRGKINFIKLVKTKESNTYRVLAEKFNNLSGKKIFEIVPIKNWPDEEYISVGEVYKGIDFIRSVISLSEKEIFILDNYLAGSVVTLLEEQFNRDQSLSIKILISSNERNNKYSDCINSLKQLKSLHPTIQIDCREGLPRQPGGLHGRFLVIDGIEIYQSGHSFAQLGEKIDRISRMRAQHAKNKALVDFEDLFNNATQIGLS